MPLKFIDICINNMHVNKNCVINIELKKSTKQVYMEVFNFIRGNNFIIQLKTSYFKQKNKIKISLFMKLKFYTKLVLL